MDDNLSYKTKAKIVGRVRLSVMQHLGFLNEALLLLQALPLTTVILLTSNEKKSWTILIVSICRDLYL